VSEKLWKLSVKENRYLPMVTPQIKSEIIRAIEDLPDDATVEDAMERLYFLAKIERGLEQSESGETISHAEIKARFLK
jgi:predicted transcriptional regulator